MARINPSQSPAAPIAPALLAGCQVPLLCRFRERTAAHARHEAGTKTTNCNSNPYFSLGRFFIYGGGHKVIAKLRLSTSEVTMLKATQCYAIHCFSVKYGFIAYCTTSGFSVYHEESDTVHIYIVLY